MLEAGEFRLTLNMPQNNIHSPLNPIPHPDQLSCECWCGLHGSADALAIANFAAARQNLTIIAAANNREAENLHTALRFFCSDDRSMAINLFPGWECLPYDTFSPHPDIVSERIRILCQLPSMGQGILIISVEEMMQKLPPVEYMTSNSLALDVGQTIDTESFRQNLIENSYESVEQVQSPGEFVYRGGLIDVFPMGSDEPIRIELFDNEIDSLRYFSTDDQLSLRQVRSIRIRPGSEIPMDENSIQKFRQAFRTVFDSDPQENEVYQNISSQQRPNGAEFYLPLFFATTSLIFEYFPRNVTIFVMEDFETSAVSYARYVKERFEIASSNAARLPLPTDTLYCGPDELDQRIGLLQQVKIRNGSDDPDRRFDTAIPKQNEQTRQSKKFETVLADHIGPSKSRTLITSDDYGQREIIETALASIGLEFVRVAGWNEFVEDSSRTATSIADLHIGLNLPEDGLRLLTSAELLGYRGQARTQTKRKRNPENIITSMQELKIGEPVVHEQYGIGLYDGLVTMQVTEHPSEFLKIKYLGEENLYVSVHNVALVSRYIGGGSEDVKLNSLNSKAWGKAKRKARKQAFDIAAELLEIQSLRAIRTGNRMPLPKNDYQEFISRFQYSETPDQQRAIESVLQDLESSRPMDRLVCGDVGFGKTEIALRAALVAVANGFQVAVIVPTRPLAQQHHDVFLDRFSDMGVQIALLSGMRGKIESENDRKRLDTGDVDIAIGTHRLLQPDIRFANLGLVIIDEEHRFGVRQKETLKKLRADVDVLTLTATPIPRTLSMALNKIRDISIIATPPDNRLSVRTFVDNWRPELVREACMRELQRGGQIFYVHNDVRTIGAVAKHIGRIIPEARIEFAHGQMPKIQLERVMKNFYMRKFDLLVCTTIIESGIDIATANTIIIDKAHRFGLAQLHQLRGRVGRSHHQAYAYLLVPGTDWLRNDARRRLEAIEAFDKLGVGYIIATHDLEIRGAGALMGEAQSGSVNDIGYSVYTRFLNEAVKTLKNPDLPSTSEIDNPQSPDQDVEIDLQIPAFIPNDWISSVNQRLMQYRRIAQASNENNLNEIKAEIRDRFGRLPQEVICLFSIKSLKLKAGELGIAELKIHRRNGRIVFDRNHRVDLLAIKNLIRDYPGTVRRIDSESALELTHRFNSELDRIERADFVMTTLSANVEAA